jgi:NTE family protein
VLGFAWTMGALSALQAVAGFDVGDVDVVVGTSAGSVVAGLLGCGLPVEVMCRHHQGVPVPGDPVLNYDYDGTGAALPPRPDLRPGAPQLLVDAVRHPRSVSPLAALAGLAPIGRGTLQPVHDLLAAVATEAGAAARWPSSPRPWVVATDYGTGRRTVFGRDSVAFRRDGSPRILPEAALADAVTASCSIPGWYPPAVIHGVPYVDGGVLSSASVDVLHGTAVDEVYVLAPMAAVQTDRPRSALGRMERMARRAVTRTIRSDIATLRRSGVRVCFVAPEIADLTAMGINLMNPVRRAEVLETARFTAARQLRTQLSRTGAPGSQATTATGSA